MGLFPMRVSFGEFLLDTDQRRLFAGDREIRLAPKVLELLTLLVSHRPRALTKDEISARLWPQTRLALPSTSRRPAPGTTSSSRKM